MIRMLRGLNVQPMAIDQQIDLEIPESIVMLAVYLSMPEAENSRRGSTTADGLRRAIICGLIRSLLFFDLTKIRILKGSET